MTANSLSPWERAGVRAGDRWLHTVSPLFDRERWSQGRWHARTGRVVSLDVSPGAIDARLEGGRAVPRRVTLRLPPLPPAQWDRIIEILAAQARFSAALLAGQYPPALDTALDAAGLSLFPANANNVKLTCTCSDSRKQPCKHAAAVCFACAERLDSDPFLLIALRGYPRQALLDTLRHRRAAQPSNLLESDAFALLLAAAQGAVTRHAARFLAAFESSDSATVEPPADDDADHPDRAT